MKEKSRKIAGIMIALAGVLELVVGISEGNYATVDDTVNALKQLV